MRIVILSSSLYSETGCAMAVRMAELGYVPAGALALPTFDRGTLLRKLGQWGVHGVASYARAKLVPHRKDRELAVSNPCLETLLKHGGGVFRSMREVAAFYDFPLAICGNQNDQDSIARLIEWTPDLIIFTGGNILRRQVLEVPRLGVLNVHLGLLPEIRGMSSPEWSLLKQVPVGITIHYMDAGIDTGPVLRRYEFSNVAWCNSLSELRNQLIVFGVEKMAEVVAALDHGAISATAQSDLDRDNQFFVMHEWLQARAAERLTKNRPAASRLNE
jgi:folate-dependent phosphoribosylglycinamide formyltransferase PurN